MDKRLTIVDLAQAENLQESCGILKSPCKMHNLSITKTSKTSENGSIYRIYRKRTYKTISLELYISNYVFQKWNLGVDNAQCNQKYNRRRSIRYEGCLINRRIRNDNATFSDFDNFF